MARFINLQIDTKLLQIMLQTWKFLVLMISDIFYVVTYIKEKIRLDKCTIAINVDEYKILIHTIIVYL